MSLQVYFVLLFSTGAMCMDLLKQKVSNVWILTGWCIGLHFWMTQNGLAGIREFLSGAMLPLLLLYPLFGFRMLGAGDIKLFSVLGGFLGWRRIIKGILWSFVIGAVFSVVFLCICGNWAARMRYFWEYVCAYGKTGKIVPYRKEGMQPEHFHFTVPIVLGMLLYAGGFY